MTSCFSKTNYNEYIQSFFCEFNKECYRLTLTEKGLLKNLPDTVYHFDYVADKYEFYIKDIRNNKNDFKNNKSGDIKIRRFLFSIEKVDFDGFVIDEDGIIFPAESHWDGWQEVTNHLYIDSNIPLFDELWIYNPFSSKEKAVEYIENFVREIQNSKEPFKF